MFQVKTRVPASVSLFQTSWNSSHRHSDSNANYFENGSTSFFISFLNEINLIGYMNNWSDYYHWSLNVD